MTKSKYHNESIETLCYAGLVTDMQKEKSFIGGNPSTFARHLLRTIAEEFGADMTGMWLLDDSKTKFKPIFNFKRQPEKFCKGREIIIEQVPRYANYLLRHQIIVAPDCLTHPALQEFVDPFLIPNNVVSLLDVAIIEGHKIIGFICVQHRKKKYDWSSREIAVIRGLALLFTQVTNLAKKRELTNVVETLTQKNQELSMALQNVMDVQRHGHQQMEENISFNITQKVMPILSKLRSGVNSHTKEFEMLEEYLQSLTSPFYRTSHKLLNLTPQERKIIELVKAGYQSKEIGQMLHLSEKTIQTHKKNIRRKLNLKGQKINLQTYLDQL